MNGKRHVAAGHDLADLPSRAWDAVHAVVARFEDAWRGDVPPALEDYLAGEADSRLLLLVELVHTDLEFRLKRGQDVRVESYVSRFPELAGHPDKVLNLIAAEFAARAKSPTPASIESFLERFPQYREPLRERLKSQMNEASPARPDFPAKPQPIKVACVCGATFAVPQELAGKKIKCKNCQQIAAVPAPAIAIPRTEANIDSLSHSAASEATLGNADKDPEMPWSFLAPARGSDEIGWLGPYRVLKVLGAGGMGVVFKAEDPHLQRLVALKAMLPAVAQKTSAKERFLREARVAAGLTHDHIVRIYQVGEDRGSPFIAMEFLEGESLDDRLKRDGRLTVEETVRIGREIAQGLAAAHDEGLIHRDIKPANIWLETRTRKRSASQLSQTADATQNDPPIPARAKILDFGLARGMTDDAHITQSGVVVGTPAYMPLEQAKGDPVDHRCDLYSLGVVLYRMVTGELPYRGKDTMSILAALISDTPTEPWMHNKDIPTRLNDLIMKLLAKNAADRPASSHEVVAQLEAIELDPSGQLPAPDFQAIVQNAIARGGKPSTRTTGKMPAQPQKPPRRRSPYFWPMILGGGAFFLLILSLTGIVILWPTPHGTVVIESQDPNVEIVFDKTGPIIKGADKNPIRLGVGEHGVVIKRGDFEFAADTFTLKDGDTIKLKIERHRDGLSLSRDGKVIAARDFPKVPPPPPPVEKVGKTGVGNPKAVDTKKPVETAKVTTPAPKVIDPTPPRPTKVLPPPPIPPIGQSPLDKLDPKLVPAAERTYWETADVKIPGGELVALCGERRDGHGEQFGYLAAFHPDGKYAVTVARSVDGYWKLTLLVWDTTSMTVVSRAAVPPKAFADPNSLSFSPDGKLLAFDRRGELVTLAFTGGKLELKKSLTAGNIEPDSVHCVDSRLVLLGERDASRELNDRLRLVDVESGAEVWTKTFDGGFRFGVSPDGKTAIVATKSGLRLLDSRTGEVRKSLDAIKQANADPAGYRPRLSADGTRIFLGKVYDATTGQLVASPPTTHGVRFSADGRYAVEGKSVRDVANDDGVGLLSVVDVPKNRIIVQDRPFARGIRDAAFSPDGERLLTLGHQGTVRLWESKSGNELFPRVGHNGPVTGCRFSSDSARLATASFDCSALVWDIADAGFRRQSVFRIAGRNDRPLPPQFFDQDRKLAVMGNKNKLTPLQLFDLKSGTPTTVTLNAGQFAVTGDGQRAVVYRSNPNTATYAAWNLSTAAEASSVQTGGSRQRCAISPDCSWAAQIAGPKLTVVDSGRDPIAVRGTVEGPAAGIGIAISADQRLLATSHYAIATADQSTWDVTLWDATGPLPRAVATIPLDLRVDSAGIKYATTGQENAYLAFTPDSRKLIAHTPSGRLTIVDIAGRKVLRHWQLPKSYQFGDIAPDGRHIAVISDEGTAAIVRLTDPELLPTSKAAIHPTPKLDTSKIAPDSEPAQQLAGFASLFDGKEMTQWTGPTDSNSEWFVANGILTHRGNGYLYSKDGDFADFHLRAECKVNDGGNGGIYFRASKPVLVTGDYEAQINSTHKDGQKTGGLFGLVKVSDVLVPADQWFTYEIIAQGDRIQLFVDGKKTCDYIETRPNRPKSGYLVLQAYARQSSFRKIEVKRLDATKSTKMDASAPALKTDMAEDKLGNSGVLKAAAARPIDPELLKIAGDGDASKAPKQLINAFRAFDPTGDLPLAGSFIGHDRFALLFKNESSPFLQFFDLATGQPGERRDGMMWSLALRRAGISPDGRTVVGLGERERSDNCAFRLQAVDGLKDSHTNVKTVKYDGSFLFSDDSRFVLLIARYGIPNQRYGIDLQTRKELFSLPITPGATTERLSPDGRYLAEVVQNYSQIQLWNLESMKVERTIDAKLRIESLTFTADSRKLAVLGRSNADGSNQTALAAFDVSSGAELSRHSARGIIATEWSRDPRKVLSVQAGKSHAGRRPIASTNLETGETTELFATAPVPGQINWRDNFIFSPDRRVLAIISLPTGGVFIYRLEND